MDTFSHIIDSHSNRLLVLDDCASGATSLLSLPAEMLLHIRSFVQARLLEELTAEIHTALTDYESALIEGLCEDCFLWNCDIYGKDVWEWVANGYKNVCDCCVKGVDSRVFSSRKVMSMQQYAQLNIKTRREWLEAYISKTYLGGADVWETINESVIRRFDCSAVVQNPSGSAEGLSTRSEEVDYMRRDLGHGSDFGTSVHIIALEDALDGVEKRLLRELGMDGQGGSQMSVRIPEREWLFLSTTIFGMSVLIRSTVLLQDHRRIALRTSSPNGQKQIWLSRDYRPPANHSSTACVPLSESSKASKP
jgi:hypothetical protein